MKLSFLPTCGVVVLVSLAALVPGDQLVAQQGKPGLDLPFLDGEDSLICDFNVLGKQGERSSFNWLQRDQTTSTTAFQRFGSGRSERFLSEEDHSPDANQDGQLSRRELTTLDYDRHRRLLQLYDSDADGQLSRYELPEKSLETVREELQRERPEPQAAPANGRQAFENLRKYGLPTTRQVSTRSKPFARAATFGTVGGFSRPGVSRRYSSTSTPSCRSSRSNFYELRYSR